jgi:hypothetical protein
MGAAQWLNLGFASLAVFYVAQICLDVLWGNLCVHLGVDYCVLWSAGRIASTEGYAQIHSIEVMQALQ